MENEPRVKEIKINIESEFVLNLVNYFTREEGYTFVGNESEIWLENLSHPKVQLMYISGEKPVTALHANYILNKMDIISSNIKRNLLFRNVKLLIINTADYDATINHVDNKRVPILQIQNCKHAHEDEMFKNLFPKIKEFSLNLSMEEIIGRLHDETKMRAQSIVRQAKIQTKPLVTIGFVGLLGLVFLYLYIRQQDFPSNFLVIHYGSTYRPFIIMGEYWRLLTAAFIHITPMHFIFNAMFIYRFGSLMENVFSKTRYLFIILVSALMANLFGFAFTQEVTAGSIGASGVAYGFIGASLFLAFEMRKTFMPFFKNNILPMIFFTTLISFSIPNVDHFGHLGGFVGGVLAATATGVPKIKPFMLRTVLAILTIITLSSGLWMNGVRTIYLPAYDGLNGALIIKYYEIGNVDRAEQLIHTFFAEME